MSDVFKLFARHLNILLDIFMFDRIIIDLVIKIAIFFISIIAIQIGIKYINFVNDSQGIYAL